LFKFFKTADLIIKRCTQWYKRIWPFLATL